MMRSSLKLSLLAFAGLADLAESCIGLTWAQLLRPVKQASAKIYERTLFNWFPLYNTAR